MIECLRRCKELGVTCPVQDCRQWIDYAEDLNCVYEAVRKNGNMTLREIAEKLNLSFVRIKQIEDKAIKKLSRIVKKDTI